MGVPNVPAAKRAGLQVDFDRLRREGDEWLTPEDRYALKTYGVCAQAQPGVFMIRCRVPAGRLTAPQLSHLADLAQTHGFGWLHLSTRQNVELHHVDAHVVPDVLSAVDAIALTNRSACGHTMRNVMACPDAGVGLDEPFDCYPDARAVSEAILARSATLNCQLPSRINIAFGGCPVCAGHAMVNDAGFESRVVDGVAGYRLWAGGSLGSAPFLALPMLDFIPRTDTLAAAEALIDVFVNHGDFENPKKGRMKFAVEALGEEPFRDAFAQAFEAARSRPHPPPAPVEVLPEVEIATVVRDAPKGGWHTGVRPQRTAGRAMVTVNVPLGDLDSDEAHHLARLAQFGDGLLYLTRNQNVLFRDVSCADVPALVAGLGEVGLLVQGADAATDVRACTGSAVCSLAITAAPTLGARLIGSSALVRNSTLRAHVSGCPNSCAQHQIADIGLAGAKVRVGNGVGPGYVVFVGGDLDHGRLGQVVGRVADDAVVEVVEAVVGTWEVLRRPAESISDTLARIGQEAFAGRVAATTAALDPELDEREPAVA